MIHIIRNIYVTCEYFTLVSKDLGKYPGKKFKTTDRSRCKASEICIRSYSTLISLFWLQNTVWISGLSHHAMTVIIMVKLTRCQMRKINRPWPKSNEFRWPVYISMPNCRPLFHGCSRAYPENSNLTTFTKSKSRQNKKNQQIVTKI